MKKRTLLLIGILCSGLGVLAQDDPAAQKLLQSVSQKYQSYRTAKIDFSLRATNQQQQTTVNQHGALIVAPKSNKYRITTEDQVLISDGKQQWNILKEEQEVQLTDAAGGGETETITPATIFTFYTKGFTYGAARDETVSGKRLAVIDLSPEDNRKSFSKVRLRIDKNAQQIYDITVFDKGGSQNQYSIQKFTPNVEVTTKTFTFDKADFPHMEMVDLR
ncbi:hypothetical protein GCM10023231_21660 [Olivibacter ginsenosidimutans]|uniref:Outer membrane lipoprotein carrier protein LolA n=1 Tax=Olivibacter ginsenosidimutans TaxID=1176537 RepID=A0ABP9BEV3_9SPHI